LGATGSESRDELQQLYRNCVRRCHPDATRTTTTGSAINVDEFSQLTHAWKILSHPKQRSIYDRTLLAEQVTLQACEYMEQMMHVAAKTMVVMVETLQDVVEQQQQQQPWEEPAVVQEWKTLLWRRQEKQQQQAQQQQPWKQWQQRATMWMQTNLTSKQTITTTPKEKKQQPQQTHQQQPQQPPAFVYTRRDEVAKAFFVTTATA
jgi:DnaJ-class molecular chaperone